MTCPIGGCHRGLAILLEDIVVNDEKRFTFVAVHERVCRISGGHRRKKRGEVRTTDSRASSEQDTLTQMMKNAKRREDPDVTTNDLRYEDSRDILFLFRIFLFRIP